MPSTRQMNDTKSLDGYIGFNVLFGDWLINIDLVDVYVQIFHVEC